MSARILETRIFGDRYAVMADWSQIASPVWTWGEDGWVATQWQAADGDGGDDEEDFADEIQAALKAAKWELPSRV